MGTFLDDLDGHEGYGARRLPDGTLTATWSAATRRFDAYVASCSCGWRGGEHPADDDGYDAAVSEWAADHARPLLVAGIRTDVSDAVTEAQQAIAELTVERPLAGRRALDDLARWADQMRLRLGPPAATGVGRRSQEPAGQPPRRRPGRSR